MELDAIRLNDFYTILERFIQGYENDYAYEREVALAKEMLDTTNGWVKAWLDEAAF